MPNFKVVCKCRNVFAANHFGRVYHCNKCGRTVYTNQSDREKMFFLGVA